MPKKLFQSKFLALSLIFSLILLITAEAAPRNINHSSDKEFTPVLKVRYHKFNKGFTPVIKVSNHNSDKGFKPVVKIKEAGKGISPAQKERFERLIEEGRKLFLEEMGFMGAIKKFNETESLAITREQKADALFYLS